MARRSLRAILNLRQPACQSRGTFDLVAQFGGLRSNWVSPARSILRGSNPGRMGTVEAAVRRLIERNVGVGPGLLGNPSKFFAVMLKTGSSHERQSHHFRITTNEA